MTKIKIKKIYSLSILLILIATFVVPAVKADNSDALYIANKSKIKIIALLCTQSYGTSSEYPYNRELQSVKNEKGSAIIEPDQKVKILDLLSLKNSTSSSSDLELANIDYEIKIFSFVSSSDYYNKHYNCNTLNPIKTYSKPQLNKTLYFDCDCQSPILPTLAPNFREPNGRENKVFTDIDYDLRNYSKVLCVNNKAYGSSGAIKIDGLTSINYELLDVVDKIYTNGGPCVITNPTAIAVVEGQKYVLNLDSPTSKLIPISTPPPAGTILVKHGLKKGYCLNGTPVDQSNKPSPQNTYSYVTVVKGDVISSLSCTNPSDDYVIDSMPATNDYDLDFVMGEVKLRDTIAGVLKAESYLYVTGNFSNIAICVNGAEIDSGGYRIYSDNTTYNIAVVLDAVDCPMAPIQKVVNVPLTVTKQIVIDQIYDAAGSKCIAKEYTPTSTDQPKVDNNPSAQVGIKNNSDIDIIAMICDGGYSKKITGKTSDSNFVNRNFTYGNDYLPDYDNPKDIFAFREDPDYVPKTINIYPNVNVAALESAVDKSTITSYCKDVTPLKQYTNIKWGDLLVFDCDCKSKPEQNISYTSKLIEKVNIKNEQFQLRLESFQSCLNGKVIRFSPGNLNISDYPMIELSSVDLNLQLNTGEPCVYLNDKINFTPKPNYKYTVNNQILKLSFDKPINSSVVEGSKIKQIIKFRSEYDYPAVCVNGVIMEIKNTKLTTEPSGNYKSSSILLNPGDKVSAVLGLQFANYVVGDGVCSTDELVIPSINSPQYDIYIESLNNDKSPLKLYETKPTGVSKNVLFIFTEDDANNYIGNIKQICVKNAIVNTKAVYRGVSVDLDPGVYKVSLVGVNNSCADANQEAINVTIYENNYTNIVPTITFNPTPFDCVVDGKQIAYKSSPSVDLPPKPPVVINTPTNNEISKVDNLSNEIITPRTGGNQSYSVLSLILLISSIIFICDKKILN
jgi:hypothetical protein